MNAVKQYSRKLFNYRFKNEYDHVKTANVIDVYKSTTEKFKSNLDTLTIWTTVITDFVPQFLKKVLSEIKKPKDERFNRMKVLKMYRDPYDHLLNDIYYTCRTRQIGAHNESNFDTIKYLIEDYKKFLKWINEIVYFVPEQKIEYHEIHYNPNPRTLSWYESKEIIPGHYSDITKLNHQTRQYYYYHPAHFEIF